MTTNAVQTTYTEFPAKGRPGQLSRFGPLLELEMLAKQSATQARDTSPVAAGIPFGRMCIQGLTGSDAQEKQAELGAATNRMIGVSLIDRSRVRAAYEYTQHLTVLAMGFVYVQVDGEVKVGNNVSANADTGELGTKAPASQVSIPGSATYVPAIIAVPGARWMSNAADNGIAELYLDGSLGAN